jgi:Spy/CpxP family protein refolding chaperone
MWTRAGKRETTAAVRRAALGIAVTCVAVAGSSGVAMAQKPTPKAPVPLAQPGKSNKADSPAQRPRRAQLEKQYRERGEQIVRKKLGLSNDQVTKLRAVDQRYAGRRRDLVNQETTARAALREEIARGSSANQTKVSQLMQQANALQRQRFELAETERRELAKFLTPVQQAQYQGLQAQIRQKIREMRGEEGKP